MTKILRRRGFTLLELTVVVAILVVLASILIMNVESARGNAEVTVTRVTVNTVREAFVGSSSAPGYLSDMKYVPDFNPVIVRMGDLFVFDPTRFPSSAAPPYDSLAQRGWRGPYLDNVQLVRNADPARNGFFPDHADRGLNDPQTFYERHFYTDDTSNGSPYGVFGERAIADQWGNPIVLQIPLPGAFDTSTDAKRFRYARLVSAGPDGVLSTPLDGREPGHPLGRLAGMKDNGDVTARGDDIVIFLNRTDMYEDEE